MNQRLEIWIIAQKWMTMNENVRKRRKKQKGGEKDEKKEEEENK